MDINNFMIILRNELNKNSFYNVELYKEFNKYDETYLIQVIAKRNYDEYECGFSIHKNWLDSITINEIVNTLLNN